MDQETIRLLISTLGVLLGSLVVAVAAVITPLLVQTRQHSAERDTATADRLRAAVVDFVDHLQRETHYDDAWKTPLSLLRVERERAFATLDTLLVGPDSSVSDWLRGFMGDRPYQDSDEAKKFFVHSGLRDLISWHQGTLPRSRLVPFRYIRNDQNGYKRENMLSWQQDAAGDLGDRP